MKFYNASFTSVMIRYYLMMAAVIIGLFSGQAWIAFFAIPLFISCLMGIRFGGMKEVTNTMHLTKPATRREVPTGRQAA